MYACAHLANSASLLLPISNLTNLLAFRATELSFARFAALMALPWAVAIAIEWGALRWVFRATSRRPAARPAAPPPPLAPAPLAVLAAHARGLRRSRARSGWTPRGRPPPGALLDGRASTARPPRATWRAPSISRCSGSCSDSG